MPHQSRASWRLARQALSEAISTPELRRLDLAWSLSSLATWAFAVVFALYAYARGGAAAVGLAALVRMLPAGVAAPFIGLLVDRRSRRDVLVAGCAVRAGILGATAVAMAVAAPLAVVFALGALVTAFTTAHKPAGAALLPALARNPTQLAAANALWNLIDSAGFLVGALLGALLVATTSIELAVGATAVAFAGAALALGGIPRDEVPEHREAATDASAGREVLEGFRVITGDRALRLLFGVFAAWRLTEGAVDVLVVVAALQVLDLGNAGVGWLNACWGLGGLAGGTGALALLARGRLARGVSRGGLLFALPLTVIAAAPIVPSAMAMFVVLGFGFALLEVAGLTLLQRLAADDVLGRTFAAVESSYWITTGVGAIIGSGLVAWLEARGALAVVGGFLPALVLVRWKALSRLEAGVPVPERPFGLLRALPLFAPLPLSIVETLARRMVEVPVEADTGVIREGDRGDRFYVVADGSLEIVKRGIVCDRAGRGDFFGETALLRDMPRTATVRADTSALLYALERDDFIGAVMAHPRSSRAADSAMDNRARNVPDL